jgi:hypothetical protein
MQTAIKDSPTNEQRLEYTSPASFWEDLIIV